MKSANSAPELGLTCLRADEPHAPHEALVRAACAGDRAAFAELYDMFEPVVRGIAVSRVGPDAVRDVVQDVFVSVLQMLPTLKSPASFPGWIASIARNRTVDHLRAASRQGEPLLYPTESDDRRDREAAAVLDLIQELPPAYAETLVLRFVEGMTGPEIATRLGMTPASVRVNLCRGMRLLRHKLKVRGEHVR